VYVVDAASGVPVGDLPAHLAQWQPDGWLRVWAGRTSPAGRVNELSVPDDETALFEFVLDTDRYFTTLGLTPFFNKVRVVFNGGAGGRYLPIVLAPQSYLVCAIVPPAATDAPDIS
jgi:5-hydroxyisourate hydrolase-like protein (transthyretin family)